MARASPRLDVIEGDITKNFEVINPKTPKPAMRLQKRLDPRANRRSCRSFESLILVILTPVLVKTVRD